jgi:hypothetical protein
MMWPIIAVQSNQVRKMKSPERVRTEWRVRNPSVMAYPDLMGQKMARQRPRATKALPMVDSLSREKRATLRETH